MAYPGRVSVCRLTAVRSGGCPNLLDSAAVGLVSLIRQHATTTRKILECDEDLWRAYDGRYHFIARSSRGMALYALHDAKGRDVEIGIDAEYTPDEAIIHFDRLRWRRSNRPGWAKGRR